MLAALLSMFLDLGGAGADGYKRQYIEYCAHADHRGVVCHGDGRAKRSRIRLLPAARRRRPCRWVVHVRAHGEVMDTRTVAEVLLPAGATTVTLRLEEFTDEIDESPVNVTLTLAGGTGYSVGDPSEATVSIDYPSYSDTLATLHPNSHAG